MSGFPFTGRLQRGYEPEQVDAFVTQVEDALSSGAVSDTSVAEQVRKVGFDLVRGGYDMAAVDRALDGLEERALAAALPAVPVDATPRDAAADAVREVLARPEGERFPRTGKLQRGYDRGDVDAFLEDCLDGLEGRSMLGPDQVRAAVFRARLGGYEETPVDDALDRVVDALLRARYVPAGGRRIDLPQDAVNTGPAGTPER